jgi:predicted Zn-dependent protease
MERLEQLLQMLAEEPNDVFLRYAIALELHKGARAEEALGALRALLQDEPLHVPSWYQCTLWLAELDRPSEALEAGRAGYLAAQQSGDRKAAAEMHELLAAIADANA